MPVIAAGELEDRGPAGGGARDAHRRHRRLGAGRDQPQRLATRHARAHALAQLDLGGRCETEKEALLGRAPHGIHHRRMRVAEDRGPPGADPVDVLPALRVTDARALRRCDRDRRNAGCAERAHRRVHAARRYARRARDPGLVGQRRAGPRRRGGCAGPAHRIASADARSASAAIRSASARAKYVIRRSAPARRRPIAASHIARGSSIQPRSAAACSIAYSPETW